MFSKVFTAALFASSMLIMGADAFTGKIRPRTFEDGTAICNPSITDNRPVVAVSSDFFSNSRCFTSLRYTYAPGLVVTLTVIDQCKNCTGTDLEVPGPWYRGPAGSTENQVEWEFN
ncbi:hypothetical protein BKA70DRAFT_1447325 [Coprinopsis sp. MPI-PUGE-AT-0042]|nr:hypothetical protein BKA70DRAFT_1447325 [Coprinopsis sp. MPI-PUGE-AT-0042]